jgi:putative phage-type endonuclease
MNIDIGIDIVRSLLEDDDHNVDRIFKRVRVMFPYVTKQYISDRIEKVKKYQSQLKVLKELPIIEQRSSEWYNMRTCLITASDFGAAVGKGKFMTLKDLYKKKCGYEPDNFVSCPPTEWGVKYEPVACSIYERLNHVNVHEFGLIRDNRNGRNFMGASPDGINDNGVMIEIKCPYNTNRPLNGQIIDQYFIQIQGQLDICELEECDFFECIFNEYRNEEDFLEACEDVTFYGAIVEKADKSYLYSSINDDVISWARNNAKKGVKLVYWVLREHNQIRVYRKEDFFFEIRENVKRVWNKILLYRNNKQLYDLEIGTTIKQKQKQPRNSKTKLNFISDEE